MMHPMEHQATIVPQPSPGHDAFLVKGLVPAQWSAMWTWYCNNTPVQLHMQPQPSGHALQPNLSLGCESDDWDGLGGLDGKVAVVDRGSCSFAIKAWHAQQAGAIALLVAEKFNISHPPEHLLPDQAGVFPSIHTMLIDEASRERLIAEGESFISIAQAGCASRAIAVILSLCFIYLGSYALHRLLLSLLLKVPDVRRYCWLGQMKSTIHEVLVHGTTWLALSATVSLCWTCGDYLAVLLYVPVHGTFTCTHYLLGLLARNVAPIGSTTAMYFSAVVATAFRVFMVVMTGVGLLYADARVLSYKKASILQAPIAVTAAGEEEETLHEGLHSAKFIAPGHRFVRGDRVILSGFDAQTRHGYPANEATLLRAIGHEVVVVPDPDSFIINFNTMEQSFEPRTVAHSLTGNFSSTREFTCMLPVTEQNPEQDLRQELKAGDIVIFHGLRDDSTLTREEGHVVQRVLSQSFRIEHESSSACVAYDGQDPWVAVLKASARSFGFTPFTCWLSIAITLFCIGATSIGELFLFGIFFFSNSQLFRSSFRFGTDLSEADTEGYIWGEWLLPLGIVGASPFLVAAVLLFVGLCVAYVRPCVQHGVRFYWNMRYRRARMDEQREPMVIGQTEMVAVEGTQLL